MTNNFDPIELLSYVRYRIYIYRVAGIHRLLEGSKERESKKFTRFPLIRKLLIASFQTIRYTIGVQIEPGIPENSSRKSL